MKLFPVQQVVFKLIEGLPLDDTEKFPVRSFEPTSGGFNWTTEQFTEKRYVEKLQREGRCVVPENFSNPEWRARAPKRVCLVTGRRAGKNTLISELATTELGRRVVSHTGTTVISLLAVATDRDQASLVLQEMSRAAMQRPELEARLANATQSYFRFQTDGDIARDGTWKGSQRQASASIQIKTISSQAKGIRGSSLVFFCMDEPDHMQANQAEEVMDAGFPSLQALAGTFLAVGSPGIKGWMRKLFGHPRDLSIRIPTWEMNPCIPGAYFEEAYEKDPATFWAEFGACWLEEVHEVRPVGIPVGCWPPPSRRFEVKCAVTAADLEAEMQRMVRGEKDEHDQVIDAYKGAIRARLLMRPHGHLVTCRHLGNYPVGGLKDGHAVAYEAPKRTVDPEVLTGWLDAFGQSPEDRVEVPMSTLNEIGQAHHVWQDKNFDDISLLTQGLALSEECGEVSRAILKTHLGIRADDRGNLADELADVILVATSLATRAGIDLDAAVTSKAARRDLKDFRARPNSG